MNNLIVFEFVLCLISNEQLIVFYSLHSVTTESLWIDFACSNGIAQWQIASESWMPLEILTLVMLQCLL